VKGKNKMNYVNEKNKKGITLIALVITIIVLLILAGITINLTMGNNGILSIAEKAGQNYMQAAEDEEKQLDNIFDVIQNSQTQFKTYEIGDEVTYEGESFYVLYDGGESSSSVTLISKYNLNLEGTEQSNTTYSNVSRAFSATNYWKNIENISYPYDLADVETDDETCVINIAKKYAKLKNAISGRLLTYAESQALVEQSNTNTKVNTMLWGGAASDGALCYWTSTVYDENIVLYVFGGPTVNNYHYKYNESVYYGVRPVLEVYKYKVNS
jgi:hypothetical protein